MDFIWYILIGLLAGYTAGKLFINRGFGLLRNLLLGIVGGLLGGFVFSLFGIVGVGFWGSLITAVIGSILVLWIASWF